MKKLRVYYKSKWSPVAMQRSFDLVTEYSRDRPYAVDVVRVGEGFDVVVKWIGIENFKEYQAGEVTFNVGPFGYDVVTDRDEEIHLEGEVRKLFRMGLKQCGLVNF